MNSAVGSEAASDQHSRSARWIACVTVLLALAYVAPHVWWMFGVSLGFPGDSSVFDDAFERTWFAIYNVVAIVLVLVGSVVILAVERRWAGGRLRQRAWLLLVVGAVLLLLRGVLGVLTSIPYVTERLPFESFATSESDLLIETLVWELWFLTSGVLYAIVARRNRPRVAASA